MDMEVVMDVQMEIEVEEVVMHVKVVMGWEAVEGQPWQSTPKQATVMFVLQSMGSHCGL